ncbi:MAG TPA: acetyltransferase [Candidatus Limnocylindria bacterium]|nr:acetyltransferase [Candidatus Limnocylindria bacterium]
MRTVIVGAGGQARIVCDILGYDRNIEVVGFTDNEIRDPGERIFDRPILGRHEDMADIVAEHEIRAAVVAIGDNAVRAERFEALRRAGLKLLNAIHPSAVISPTATLGEGNVVSPGAFVNTLARIGDNCIINTGAIVEHEVTVGSHVHLAPGVIVAGRVSIGDMSFIGAGSVVREYVTVGERVVVGAGSVVLDELASDVMAAGAPATVRKVNGARAGEEGRP